MGKKNQLASRDRRTRWALLAGGLLVLLLAGTAALYAATDKPPAAAPAATFTQTAPPTEAPTAATLAATTSAATATVTAASPSTGLLETPPSEVKLYRVFELALGAQSAGRLPYRDGPDLQATFSGLSGEAAGQRVIVRGFWDGANVWRLRFAAQQAGTWRYETVSNDPGLDGASGTVQALPPTAEDLAANPLYHGFLEADGYAFRLSDGEPFLPVGDTQWSFAEENTTAEWEAWMQARKAQGFNTFLGSVWLALYDRPHATEHPFPDKDPKTEDLQVAYFQRLDEMVQFANDQGIIMGLAIGGFPDNSSWFQRFGAQERNDRWFRYVVARYSAYNVRWILYGEANEAGTPWGSTWQQESRHSARLVRDMDPYDHLTGNHHTFIDTDNAANPMIDYIEVQAERSETQYQVALEARRYGKPVWFEEYWYEPAEYDDEIALGIRNTHRNFIAAMAFPTMGSLMRAHYPNFDINQVERDPGAIRMGYFARFFSGLNLYDFEPASDRVDRGQAGRFGDDYAVFLHGGGVVNLDLRDRPGLYSLETLNINSGEVRQAGMVRGGAGIHIDAQTHEDVSILLRFTGPDTGGAPPTGASIP